MEEFEATVALCRSTSTAEKTTGVPEKRAVLEIPCSGAKCDKACLYKWSCQTCMAIIKYGFDMHVYCRCGKVSATSLEFKCIHPEHGDEFKPHDASNICKLLSSLEPHAEMNILILGETGVGKSTWINGFFNFLSHNTLKDALGGELITLIPSQFTVFDADYKRVTVLTGVDTNEVNKTGESATQHTKVYPFTLGNTTIQLIDTPGIGDTRGIEQDKKNLEDILKTLNFLDEIHGICILLKPNNARLTITLRFCINELLTYLHRDAEKNIVFCFTNSRSTLYKPGDTLDGLESLLQENKAITLPLNKSTIYCFDSEAYRFLAAKKNDPPVKFEDGEEENFEKSWNHSLTELQRLLAHFRKLKPHNTRSTLSLNYTRTLVLKLNLPLIDVGRNIEKIKNAIEEEKKEIERTKADIENLKKKQFTSRPKIKPEFVPFADTYEEMSTGDMLYAGYLKCTLWMNFTEHQKQLNRERTLRAKTGYFKMTNVVEKVEDASVTDALKKSENAAEMKKAILNAKNKEIQEYEDERIQVEKACAKFAYFLKNSAITIHHDAMQQYLDYLIHQEEQNGNNDNFESLDQLKAFKVSYEKEKELLEETMSKVTQTDNDTENSIGPDDIQELVDQLQKLKHSGGAIRDAVKCITFTDSAGSQLLFEQSAHNNTGKFKYLKKSISKLVNSIMHSFG